MIRIILAVTNDLVTDNRVHKVATTLSEQGYKVIVVGRKLNCSPPASEKGYSVHRFKLMFNRSVLFYANYNIRLFFYLLAKPVDLIVANDLDTLPACWLASKLRRKTIIFDSHELFSELPELVGRPLVKSIWQLFERILIPQVRFGYTVSQSIQTYYQRKYYRNFELVRNAGFYRKPLPDKKTNQIPVIIYQGYVNRGRGIDLMLYALQFIDNVKLCIAGNGDMLEEMKALALKLKVDSKVEFLGRVAKEKLVELTGNADLGISLEEDLGLNYRYALPNKLFDYIQSRIPVIVSDLPEMRAIVENFQIGLIVHDRDPKQLANKILEMFNNKTQYLAYRVNLEKAAAELCWENEKNKLISLYDAACVKPGVHTS